MLAHLLLSAVIVLLVFIAWQLGRRGSTQTQVAGDQVTLQALRADIAELQEFVAQVNAEHDRLRETGDQMAHQVHTIAQVLKVRLTADMRSSEQQGLASVCSTGGHLIQHRVR